MAINFYSPELEALKKSMLSYTWDKSPYEELFQEQYQRLQQPISQDQINLIRSNIAGQTKSGIQEAQKALSPRGFVSGQSGVADRVIGNVLRSGQQAFSQTLGNVMSQQDAINKQLTNELLGTMGQLKSYGVKNATDVLGTIMQGEAVPQQFELNKLMQFLNMLYGYYGGEQQNQMARYSPYWNALATIYGG